MINLEYFGSEGMDTMRQRSAEILCIGTEILMGDIVNTNAAYIAKELAGLGINVYHQSVVEITLSACGRRWSLLFRGRTSSSPPAASAPPMTI